MTALLAFDTATERTVVALRRDGQGRSDVSAGGAKASTTLIPTLLRLLTEMDLRIADLDAIAFGRGPGAFTGLRTACSVAQGLAFGAGKPVLPIDSLLIVAEDARAGASETRIWSVVDARMNQIYAAEYRFHDDRWTTLQAPILSDAEALSARWKASPPTIVAGDALRAYAGRLDTGGATLRPEARIDADALGELAERAWHAGLGVDPADALPLYVRDKVAETTLEREARR